MYRTVMAFLFCLLSPIANAQEVIDLSKQLKCSDVQIVMNYFADTHKELPVWLGKTVHNTHIALLANKETRSWTMIEYDARLACVLGAGDEKTSSNLEFL
jgi:hypothetical protein